MYSGTSLDIIRLQSLVIIELLPRENEPNLVHLYALLFLQLLLHGQNLLLWFEVEGLLAARERLDEDLLGVRTIGCAKRQTSKRANPRVIITSDSASGRSRGRDMYFVHPQQKCSKGRFQRRREVSRTIRLQWCRNGTVPGTPAL